MDRYDVAVIGAGPAGFHGRQVCAKSGAQTVLLEEHAAIGWPVEWCAGLLGSGAIAESELSGGPFILRGMFGAAIFSPAASRLHFKAPSCKAYVVDRRLFRQSGGPGCFAGGAQIFGSAHSSAR